MPCTDSPRGLKRKPDSPPRPLSPPCETPCGTHRDTLLQLSVSKLSTSTRSAVEVSPTPCLRRSVLICNLLKNIELGVRNDSTKRPRNIHRYRDHLETAKQPLDTKPRLITGTEVSDTDCSRLDSQTHRNNEVYNMQYVNENCNSTTPASQSSSESLSRLAETVDRLPYTLLSNGNPSDVTYAPVLSDRLAPPSVASQFTMVTDDDADCLDGCYATDYTRSRCPGQPILEKSTPEILSEALETICDLSGDLFSSRGPAARCHDLFTLRLGANDDTDAASVLYSV